MDRSKIMKCLESGAKEFKIQQLTLIESIKPARPFSKQFKIINSKK